MTREGAKGNLIHAIRWKDMPSKEALEIAIKALEEREPCEDAISRQTVMEHYSTGELAHCNHISRNNLLDFIEQLPPVTPQPKMGHWHIVDERPEGYRKVICSNCKESIFKYHNMDFDYRPKYCPNCGERKE